jgi:hypothetical protein
MASARDSGVVAGTDGEDPDNEEEWDTNIQPVSREKPYLWNYEVTFYNTGESPTTDPTIIAYYTEDGRGIQSISEIYRVTLASSIDKPTKDKFTNPPIFSGGSAPNTSTWYKNSPPTSSTNKYLWNAEMVTYTDGVSEIFEPSLIGTHGDTGTAGSSIKKINTYVREFPYAKTTGYPYSWTSSKTEGGTAFVDEGHTETWTAQKNSGYDNSHIKVGDIAYLVGKVVDRFSVAGEMQDITLYGEVNAVNNNGVTMTTLNAIWGGTLGAQGDSAVDYELQVSP